jgi:phage gp46-like protein
MVVQVPIVYAIHAINVLQESHLAQVCTCIASTATHVTLWLNSREKHAAMKRQSGLATNKLA